MAKTAVLDQAIVGDNGRELNGVSLNGRELNGRELNGTDADGNELEGSEFVGATFEGLLDDGTTIELRIDAMSVLPAPNDDVYTYEISAYSDGGWWPVCGYEADGVTVRSALAVPGVWDSTTAAWSDDGSAFTIACRGASIAKCVELGYKTWDGFSDHHHACVRMLRADYCGDGTPYTVDGTAINLYDNAGVQVDTEEWLLDGEWTPDGAICFNNHRGSVTPACAEKYSASCGSFASGALLINERE